MAATRLITDYNRRRYLRHAAPLVLYIPIGVIGRGNFDRDVRINGKYCGPAITFTSAI